MTVILTWLAGLLENTLAPLIEKWISNMVIAKQVSDLQAQQAKIIQAVGALESAKTPTDIQNAVQSIATATNS